MATIRREDIRARITIGTLVIETPDVLSFSVSRSRGQPSASFNATIEVSVDYSFQAVGDDIIIEAGLKDNLNRIFTGEIEQVQVNPHWEKSERYLLSISGRDRMARLEGKRFSRRQRSLGLGKLGIISGIVSKSKNKGKIRVDSITDKADGGGNFLSSSLNLGEVPNLIRTRDVDTSNPYSLYSKDTKPATKPEDYDLLLSPGFVHLPQHGTQVVVCDNCSTNGNSGDPTQGIKWTSVNPDITSVVQDPNDPKKGIVTQQSTGSTTVMVEDAKGKLGKINTSGILVHDHASIGAGGAAYGVYRSG